MVLVVFAAEPRLNAGVRSPMFIDSYIEGVIKEHLGGDARRFDELWSFIPDFGTRLRSFNHDSSWLHWTRKTLDGWYCVAAPIGYDVYFQEQGAISRRRHFISEQEAARYAINASVFSLPARSN